MCFGLKLLVKGGLNNWKCLLHRSGFGHQIAGAPAAYYIAFFSLFRFKYSTLTCRRPSRDDIVVSMLGCEAKGWDIDSHWTCLVKLVLESYFAT